MLQGLDPNYVDKQGMSLLHLVILLILIDVKRTSDCMFIHAK